MSLRLLTVRIRQEQDVVAARQRARQLTRLLGFDEQDQVRIATAVSELARNVYNYAREGEVEFSVDGQTPPQVLVTRVADQGPGIADVNLILSGRYRSTTGMGLGLLGARRLMDRFAIESEAGRGTTITIKKLLPPGSPFLHARDLGRLSESLAREGLQNPLAEVQQQNQELLHVLEDLRRRQEDLVRLNRELEDTNRGVVALYAELDEKAEHLRRADEMKSRFLSNMSHEFRTPLNSILAISKLLQERTDGDLTTEQERQVGFVRKAAHDLTELVNDLLDLAKVEAGKTVVRPVEFEVKNLFGALRGMLRPLLVTETVRLVFEEDDLPEMYSDEAKISQILRNFISNALKFTERGEIRIAAELADERRVVFSVADTGIGIAPEDLERIFSEFGQVENPLQKHFKGTGLGLALSRKLAELLGGGITVESVPGRGSTFRLTLPRLYEGMVPAEHLAPASAAELDPARVPVLVVEDSAESLHVYDRLLRGTPFQVIPARTIREAERRRASLPVRAVILDIQLAGEDTWGYLARLKGGDGELPVLVVTSVDDQAKAASLGADAYAAKPIERTWLVRHLRALTGMGTARALLIDDEEVPRYALRALLGPLGFDVTECAEPEEGLRRLQADPPDVVFLDLIMPGLTGLALLEQLRQDARTRDLPAILITSKVLVAAERDAAARLRASIVSKDVLGLPQAAAEIQQSLSRAGWAADAPPSAPLRRASRT